MYVDHGSVKPIIERDLSDIADIYGDDEFDLASRHIGDVVTAVHEDDVRSVVIDLPSFDIGDIARLGKTLKPSEQIVFSNSLGQEAILDARVRRFLDNYSHQTFETRARLVGRVTSVDAAKRRFTVWSEDSQRYCRGPFHDSSDLPLLSRAITEDRLTGPAVELEGSIILDTLDNPSGWSRLYSLKEKSSDQGTPFDNLEIQLRNLGRVHNRWFDDDSQAPTSSAIRMATDIVDLLKYRSLPAPTAFPTPDGGVSLEWITGDVQIGVTILASGNEGELSFWNARTGGDGLEQAHELDADRVVAYVSRIARDSTN